MRSSALAVGVFLIGSLLVSSVVYRGALTGDQIIAPLDIPTKLFPKFVGDSDYGVPENHYVIDQITYDLPLQHLIHSAVRGGSEPWWDPYTMDGRPLFADAHINAYDPVRRLCYAIFATFSIAYNWTIVVKGLLAGLGCFLLLWRIRRDSLLNTILALAFQFCGSYAHYVGHPWIQGSTLYIPYLMLGMCELTVGRRVTGFAYMTLSSAGFILAGNLQSYAHFALFALVLLASFAWTFDKQMLTVLTTTVAALGLAAMSTAFVWVHVLELFLTGSREVSHDFRLVSVLSGPLALGLSPVPWLLGPHTVPDLSKVVASHGTNSGLAFNLFAGSTTVLLAAAAFGRSKMAEQYPHSSVALALRRTSLAVLIGYAIILSTPIGMSLYSRISPFAVLGVIILARLKLNSTFDGHASRGWELRIGQVVLAVVVASWGACAAFNLIPDTMYADIQQKYLALQGHLVPGDPHTPLRLRQIENIGTALLPHHVYIGLSTLSLVLFVLSHRGSDPKRLLLAAVATSTSGVIAYYMFFMPLHSVELLSELIHAPRQHAVSQALSQSERLREPASDFSRIYPLAMAALYRVHVSHGYAALFPKRDDSPGPWARMRPVSQSDSNLFAHARFALLSTGSTSPVPLSYEPDGLNRYRIALPEHEDGALIVEDTIVPGWTFAAIDNKGERHGLNVGNDDLIRIKRNHRVVEASYYPTYFIPTLACTALGLMIFPIMLLVLARKQR